MPLLCLGNSSLFGISSDCITDLQYFPLCGKAATSPLPNISASPDGFPQASVVTATLASPRKMYRCTEDYIPREDEYYIEDTPIYGNLDDVVPEPVDENCYEQMKARPERSANELQKATAPAQTTEEAQVFYSFVDHNSEGKRRKPKKQKTDLSHKDEETQLCAADAVLSNTTSVDNFPFESQEVEENVHDDPIRLFGLIRAKREPINSLDYDIAQ
ncbi:T-cell receptor-associated transmembrane adapter 1 isoform X1 [Panthera uncia]|uniref:T-cell receptor-associated transmembrane adapter 1 isoform X1 n=1 Tax=Panthera leo TaxID=9689 RepID=UPI001C697995|nr:T-cell receptor-associated transmembrane adapter 1 isoform X1 [Panthera leo]XP_042810937.1 T-cell receptor-associated transmembrane adapter 1 isoform X1 [Panthera leo]XP_049484102.1 T-cell receptor-associated transmembrane adapter 1 isoform X1 [Panthera uncia]XP_049484103.1 T-cell receptor-associated transmembrane adapter 1 isoform X1 [Panthera uncia]